jgi:hypothetical protein
MFDVLNWGYEHQSIVFLMFLFLGTCGGWEAGSVRERGNYRLVFVLIDEILEC